MIRMIVLVAVILYVPLAFADASCKADCLNDRGTVSKCAIENQGDTLAITFAPERDQHLNRVIPGNKITHLGIGEYAGRRVSQVASRVAPPPVKLLSLINQKMIKTYSVEYLDDNNSENAALVQVRRRHSPELENLLQTVSGKTIESGPVP